MRAKRPTPQALLILLTAAVAGAGVAPELVTWIVNCDGSTGYNGIEANVQSVEYTAGSVYIRSTGIPSHPIGPWPGNPNDAIDKNYLFRIPRVPQQATNHVATPLGPIGVFVNGVPVFSADDGRSYQNQDVWNQNAVLVESISFDNCLGHPTMTDAYHYHQVPECLQVELGDDGLEHSPIIGWARDGYPVYGPYAYSNPTDPNSPLARMLSSYQKRSITDRHVLPDGSVLPPNQWGPNISAQFPLGMYLEDFEFLINSGDLDIFNGRFAVTPEFPGGTYAYFASSDPAGENAYPYLIGPEYNGVPILGNNHTVPGTALDYDACPPPVNNYCATNPNSAGTHAAISNSGSTSVSTNDFGLQVTGAAPAQFGLFFYAANQSSAPFGNGYLCVGGQLFRLTPAQLTDAGGNAARLIDFTNQTVPAGGEILPGSTWNFQYYHRDTVGSGFNLSDGLNVPFLP